jgi:LysR family transcriptional regulator, glycine cleavage system transcriptional activator
VVIAPFGRTKPDTGDLVLRGRLLGSKVRPRDWAVWHRHAGVPGNPSPLLFESTTLAIQAAVEGLGVVICSPGFVREEVRTGRLVPLAEGAAMTGDCYWLVLPQGRISQSLQVFADWLVREATSEDAAQALGLPRRPGGRKRNAAV